MQIICSSMEEFKRLSEERGCPWYPVVYTNEITGNQEECVYSWWAGNDELILKPSGGSTVNVDVNVQEIKQQILDELNINNEENEDFELVHETYSQGYKYQLIRKEVSDDEFKRSKRVKRKRSSKSGDQEGNQRGAC